MKQEESKIASLNFALIYESLIKSMDEAGGSPKTVNALLNMSAFDLLWELGANHIYFTYVPTPTPGIGDCNPEKKRL